MKYDLSTVHLYCGRDELVTSHVLDTAPVPVSERRLRARDVNGCCHDTRLSELRIVRRDQDGIEHEMRCNTEPPAGPDVRVDGSVGRGAILWALVCTPLAVVALVGLWVIARWWA